MYVYHVLFTSINIYDIDYQKKVKEECLNCEGDDMFDYLIMLTKDKLFTPRQKYLAKILIFSSIFIFQIFLLLLSTITSG
jgi:hypothetical protein